MFFITNMSGIFFFLKQKLSLLKKLFDIFLCLCHWNTSCRVHMKKNVINNTNTRIVCPYIANATGNEVLY